MSEPLIPLSEPFIGPEEVRAVKECLESGWVSTAGPYIARFEKALAERVGAPHAVAAVNGTAALHTALLAVGVRPGDEVLVPDLTFVAPANAVRYCGAFPVFIDAEPDHWQMDPAKVERFLAEECEQRGGACVNRRSGRRVRAVLPVHLLGLACDIERIAASARRRGLKVVEDACEGLGVRRSGRHVGTFGDAGVFSFNGNKIITTGGGGVIVTSDAALAKKAAYLTTQAKDDPVEYFHNEVGYNYRLTSMQAALGLAQLARLDDLIARRRRTAQAYERGLAGAPGVRLMPRPAGVEATFWLYTVLLEGAGVDTRKGFIDRLGRRGVQARPLWHNLSDLPPFADCQAYEVEVSRRLYAQAVSLPSSASLTEEQQRRCVEAVRAELPVVS